MACEQPVFRPRLKLSDGYPDISPYLADPVRELQKALGRWGFMVTPDGQFGASTESALRLFQVRQGIAAHGTTCPATWDSLLGPDAVWMAQGWHPVLSTPVAKGSDVTGKNPALVAVESSAKDSVTLDVPWYSQFEKDHGYTPGGEACFKACLAMAKAVGTTVLRGSNQIPVHPPKDGKDGDGHVKIDPAALRRAIAYIDEQLDAGRAVVVGVAYKGAFTTNPDGGVTDHFVVIYGRNRTRDGTFYLYNDPGSTTLDSGRGRFVVDRKSGELIHEGRVAAGAVTARHTEMSTVMKNQD